MRYPGKIICIFSNKVADVFYDLNLTGEKREEEGTEKCG